MRIDRLLAGVASVSLVAIALTALSATTASAIDKPMSASPTSGTKTSPINLVTGQQCSSGDKIQVVVTGSGFPGAGYSMTGKDATSTKLQGGGYSLPLLETMSDAASAQTPVATLSGVYTFSARCYSGLSSTVLDSFSTSIVFQGNNYGAASVTATLSAIATQIAPGRSVTMTANLSAAFGSVPAGSVEFFDGVTSLGTAAVAEGDASKSLTKSNFAQGAHAVKAIFTPTNSAYAAVQTSVTNFSIQTPQTTVTLVANPASPVEQYSLVTLTATVTPSDAVGTVDFLDGSARIGSGVVTAGIASITKGDFSVSDHALTATFVPTSSNDFATSTTAGPLALSVTPRSGPAPLTETLQARVDATGSLAISLVPGEDGIVSFGTLALSTAADRLEASGTMDPVLISDTRFNSPGWQLSAQATPFVGTSTKAQVSGAYAGITPQVLLTQGNQATSGATVTAATAVQPADPTAAAVTTGGLASKVTIATATTGWRGLARVGAAMALAFPLATAPDTYNSTLTLTVS